MRKFAILVVLLGVLAGGAAQAALVNLDSLTVGETYTLDWNGSLDYSGTFSLDGASKTTKVGVMTFGVSKGGTYLGEVQTVCIDFNTYLTDPFTYTLRKGYSSSAGMVSSEEDWDALTHVVNTNKAAMGGSAADRAGLGVAAWELAAGDSTSAYQSDWNSTDRFRVSSVDGTVRSAADTFLKTSRPGMDWSGDLYWFDGVGGSQDLLTGVPEVPAWAVMQFGLMGFGWLGMKRRSRKK